MPRNLKNGARFCDYFFVAETFSRCLSAFRQSGRHSNGLLPDVVGVRRCYVVSMTMTVSCHQQSANTGGLYFESQSARHPRDECKSLNLSKWSYH